MPERPVHVLLVEDSPAEARLVREALLDSAPAELSLSHSTTLADTQKQLKANSFDAILLDLSLPDSDGLSTVLRAREVAGAIPIVVLTGYDSESLAIQAVQSGAQDYIVKGEFTGDLLARSIRYAIERQRIERALRESEERFRRLVESLQVGVMLRSGDGSIVFANHTAMQILKTSHAELIGRPFPPGYEALDAEGRPLNQEQLPYVRALRGHKVRNALLGLTRGRDSERLWLLVNADPQVSDGSVQQIITTFSDITESKNAREALANQATVLDEQAHLLDLAHDSIIVRSMTGEIMFWNHGAEEMYGYRKDEALGQNSHVLLSTDFPAELSEIEAELLQNDRWEGELVQRRRNGSAVVVASRWALQRRSRDRAPRAVLEISTDVTVQKGLEEQLRQSQKMEAIGRLAGGVAHDFNNLLTVITSYGEVVRELLEPGQPGREEIEEITKAAARAASLTQKLLAFGRQQMLNPQVLDLNSVVIGMEMMLRRLIGEHIELITNCEDGLQPVKADPSQLEQVILNLAVNSRDAMPQGGQLRIETSAMTITPHQPEAERGLSPGLYAVLSVSDTGVGMDTATRARIFEPFFTTKELGKGTGLGLAMVHGIIEQSGGHILVDSEPGRGTKFRIFLPAVGESALSPAVRAHEQAESGSETVLIVEDDPSVRKLVRRVLVTRGYQVLEADESEAALNLCMAHRQHIHLLVSDVVMPGIEGDELARSLLQHHPEMKVLFISGYSDNLATRSALVESGVDFLPKPFTPEALARKVRDVLDSPVQQKAFGRG